MWSQRFFFFFSSCGGGPRHCVFLIDGVLPDVVSIQDATKNPSLFSGERSMRILKKITDLGERQVGSRENEILCPEVIVSEILEIKKKADPVHSILHEVQKGNGSFDLRFALPFISIYQNIKNVIAILEGSDGQHGVLVNCHFDSGSSSVGASDDAINCAVMLELLRVLSQSKVKLKHNVVFLFNGAEEVGLMGSHLFLQHKWAKKVDVVLNLEAAGLGGRAILFQSGPQNGWLFQYYARNAPHPHGQIMGEEIFQSGLIPSDTDFRIFRDFAKMPGLDFAFGHNGYVYHTIYDREEYIKGGSHQHIGDNLLAVIRKLAHAPELENMEAHSAGSMVYFDYLGWFMVRYSFGAGIAINILVFLLAGFSIVVFMGRLLRWKWLPQTMGPVDEWMAMLRKSKRSSIRSEDKYYKSVPGIDGAIEEMSILSACLELSLAILVRLCSLPFALGINSLMALFIDGVAPMAMPYYSNIYLIFPFYWCTGLAAYATLPMLYDMFREKKRPLSLSMRCQLNLVASHCIWSLLLFILTCASVRSSAILMVQVLFKSLALLCIHLTPLYKSARTWIYVYLAVYLPAFLYSLYVMLLGYVLVIPITGRSGFTNGDLYIAVSTSLFMFCVASFAMPLMTIVRKPWLVLTALMSFCFIMMVIALPTKLGHPYQKGPNDPAPQRYWIMHTERKFYDENQSLRRHDWGYFVVNQDRNSPNTIPDHQKQGIVTLEDDCKNEMHCGLPFYYTRMIPLSYKSNWIPTIAPPIQPVIAKVILNNKQCINTEYCTFTFTLQGPDRMSFIFTPREDVVVDSWNLEAPLISFLTWQGRPSYFLHIVGGEVIKEYIVILTLKVSGGNTSRPLLDVSLAGNNVHHGDRRTDTFKSFVSDLPDYVTLMGWISSLTAYIF